MSDRFKRVSAGDAFDPSAAQWNAMVEAAEKTLTSPAAPGAIIGGTGFYPTAIVVEIHNNSGQAVDQFEALGIEGPMFDSTNGRFLFEVSLSGNLPEDDGPFVVAAEPISINGVGRGFISGVFPATINVTLESHTNAVPVENQIEFMTSATEGGAEIIWKQSGTGTKRAILRIGGTGGGSLPVPQYPRMLVQAVAGNVLGAGFLETHGPV